MNYILYLGPESDSLSGKGLPTRRKAMHSTNVRRLALLPHHTVSAVRVLGYLGYEGFGRGLGFGAHVGAQLLHEPTVGHEARAK